MANHVSSYVNFYNINDEDFSPFKAIVDEESVTFNSNAHDLLAALDFEVPDEDDVDINWYFDNVGPKWCYFDELDENGFCTTSAWCAPTTLVEKIVALLEEKYPGTYATMSYEDEAYNFIGTAVIGKDGLDECVELECDEILSEFAASEGRESVDFDEIYSDDEGLNDAFYDFIADFLSENEEDNVRYYLEYLKEIEEVEEINTLLSEQKEV